MEKLFSKTNIFLNYNYFYKSIIIYVFLILLLMNSLKLYFFQAYKLRKFNTCKYIRNSRRRQSRDIRSSFG